MIFSLDFWPYNSFGFGFTIMVRERFPDGLWSGFEWQVKFGKLNYGTGEKGLSER